MRHLTKFVLVALMAIGLMEVAHVVINVLISPVDAGFQWVTPMMKPIGYPLMFAGYALVVATLIYLVSKLAAKVKTQMLLLVIAANFLVLVAAFTGLSILEGMGDHHDGALWTLNFLYGDIPGAIIGMSAFAAVASTITGLAFKHAGPRIGAYVVAAKRSVRRRFVATRIHFVAPAGPPQRMHA